MTNKNGRGIIARLIATGGATIPELAEALDISIGTATSAVASLLEEGYLRDQGKASTGSGRKPHVYSLHPDAGIYVGIDLCESHIRFGLMDMAGQMLKTQTQLGFKLENTEESLQRLCETVREYQTRIPEYRDRIRRVCVNIPGRINAKTGYSYTYFNFTGRPLTGILSESFGKEVCISNDTRSMAYAEYLKGCTDGEQNVIFINVNWGLGVGLILDGKPYFGKSGYAGEFGHIHAFENQVICQCGKMGCLETEVSGQALRRKLTERIRRGESSILSERVLHSDVPLTLEEILHAVQREDTLCIDVIGDIGGLLGTRIAGLINLLNPELVVIGGELSLTGDYLLQPLRMNIIKHSLARANQDTLIRTSTLGGDTGVTGACLVARSSDFGLV